MLGKRYVKKYINNEEVRKKCIQVCRHYCTIHNTVSQPEYTAMKN